MGILAKIEALLKGKKTYVVAVLIGICAVLQNLGITVPDIVWPILGALGLGAVRSGIKNSTPPLAAPKL